MKKTTSTSVLVLLLLCANFYFVKAQEYHQKLTNKLEALVNESSTYKNYRLIDERAISNFESELDNYILKNQSNQVTIKNQFNENAKNILVLQNQIKELKKVNERVVSEEASISFLGFLVPKNIYLIAMWALLFVAMLTSVVLYFKFKNANEITKSSKLVLQDLEDEYEAFRRVCIEREQSLRRQLFNEIKKTNELRDAS
ncbi:MAG: hypothetical protein ACK4M1_03390 [Flavobacterium sp.]